VEKFAKGNCGSKFREREVSAVKINESSTLQDYWYNGLSEILTFMKVLFQLFEHEYWANL
jgi:hypothetical protein